MSCNANIFQAEGGFSEIEDFTAAVMGADEGGTEESRMKKIGYDQYDQWLNDGASTHFVSVYRNNDSEYKYVMFVDNVCGCYEVVICRTYGDFLAFVAAFLPVLKQLNNIGKETVDTMTLPKHPFRPAPKVVNPVISKKPKQIKKA